jgi:hypothetical protein
MAIAVTVGEVIAGDVGATCLGPSGVMIGFLSAVYWLHNGWPR